MWACRVSEIHVRDGERLVVNRREGMTLAFSQHQAGKMCNASIRTSLEDVQSTDGHADLSTITLYDRRGYNPEKSAIFANDKTDV